MISQVLSIVFAICLATLPQGIAGKSGIGGGFSAGGGATFVPGSPTQCQAVAVASCTNSGLSFASGDIIVVAISATAGTSWTVADSNSDTPSCATAVEEVTNLNWVQLCTMKAGALVTTVSCTQTVTTQTINCLTEA